MRTMPFFLTNEEWYVEDENDPERRWKLTDKAPQEAIDSYNEFYTQQEILVIEPDNTVTRYILE